MFEPMTARKAYLDVIKEQHMMNAISLCLSSFNENMSSEDILHCIYKLEINDKPIEGSDEYIVLWQPFENLSPNQVVNYIVQIAISAMHITTNALDNSPANYIKGESE